LGLTWQRNIGNQFHTNDDSAQAVVEYGIGHLNASNGGYQGAGED
jgi:carbonic anhydrase